MRYTQARELVEAALEILNEMPQTKARKADMLKKIKRETKAYLGKPGGGRGLKSLLKQDAEEARSGTLYGRGGKKIKKASAVNEESAQEMSARKIKDFQGHIDHLRGAIDYHSRRKPGWSDRHGEQTKEGINAKVKDLIGIHATLISRHKKALENHAAGNFGANQGHYILNTGGWY